MKKDPQRQDLIPGLFVRIVLPLLIVIGSAFGQGTTGAIDVTVTDTSGSVVPGAKVTAVNLGTGAAYSAEADGAGRAQFLLLRAGTYSVTVEHQGFEKLVRDGVIVNSTDIERLNLKLAIGAVSETVTVAGTTPLLQSEHATLGQVVEQRQITGTPLATRNFTQLLGAGAGSAG